MRRLGCYFVAISACYNALVVKLSTSHCLKIPAVCKAISIKYQGLVDMFVITNCQLTNQPRLLSTQYDWDKFSILESFLAIVNDDIYKGCLNVASTLQAYSRLWA